MKSLLAMSASLLMAAGAAQAAVVSEPLQITITSGEFAGEVLLGSISFDDSTLTDGVYAGETLTAEANDLAISFPLPGGLVLTEADDYLFPAGPEVTFDLDGAVSSLAFDVFEVDYYLEFLGDLAFVFELGPNEAPTAVGEGFVLGGSAVPLPAAALLFAPALAGLSVLRRRRA